MGLSSVVIEKQKKFSETLKGEYIQPAGLSVLEKIGIAPEIEQKGMPVFTLPHYYFSLSPLKKSRIVDFFYPNDLDFPDHAVAIPHLELKNILIGIYIRLGGIIFMDCLIDNIQSENSMSLIITLKNQGEEMTVKARHVAVSEGVMSLTAKKLDARWVDDPLSTSYMVGGVTTNDTVPAGKFITAQSREGLVCTFKISPQLTRAYLYKEISGKSENPFKNNRPDACLKSAIQSSGIVDLFANAHFDRRVMAAPYIPRFCQTPSVGNITLTGDSAGASHPLGGYGMSTAAADGVKIAELLKDLKDEKINESELNKLYNDARRRHYLTAKFTSEAISYIFGGTTKKSRAVHRLCIGMWASQNESMRFCGKLFGGMLTNPLSLNDFLKVWGIKTDLSSVPWSEDIPFLFYKSRRLSPGRFLSDMMR